MTGVYTEITIVAPMFAVEGESIATWIDVKALGVNIYVLVAVQLDGEYLSVFPAYPQLIEADQTFRFGVSLVTMPNHDVLVIAETFYEWMPGEWMLDDTATHTVELTGPPPPPPEPTFSEFGVASFSKV